jgi:ABC-2 type transport system ATP-binding protein
VATTGVIDIIPAAGDPSTDAYEDGYALDGDPDVEALGEIDAELSAEDLADDEPDEGPGDEPRSDGEPADADRPWETYVKTDADVEADAFFAAFTAEGDQEAAAAAAEPPDVSPSPGSAEADDHDGIDHDGGEQR